MEVPPHPAGRPTYQPTRARARTLRTRKVTANRTSTPPRLLVVDDDARYGRWLGHHLGVFCPDSSLSVTQPDRVRPLAVKPTRVAIATSCCSRPRSARAPRTRRRAAWSCCAGCVGEPVFPAVIALAEDGNELTAVRALQLGAVDYLPKRLLTPERLNTSVRLALRRIEKRVQRKLASLAHVTDVSPPPEDETTREQPKPNAAGISQSVVSLAIAASPRIGKPRHRGSAECESRGRYRPESRREPEVGATPGRADATQRDGREATRRLAPRRSRRPQPRRDAGGKAPDGAVQTEAKSSDSPIDDAEASSFEFSAEAARPSPDTRRKRAHRAAQTQRASTARRPRLAARRRSA